MAIDGCRVAGNGRGKWNVIQNFAFASIGDG